VKSGESEPSDSAESADFESVQPKSDARTAVKPQGDDRANRRADALRANLRRRKDQSRARRRDPD
jgi:hypothetical protein